VRGILQSYRWRRRLAWLGGLAALSAGVVVAGLVFANNHGTRLQLEPTGTTPPQTVAVDRPVRVTAAERRAVNRTLVAFVRSAVTRDDPAAAWGLATPAMRSGVNRKQWNEGQLPVAPFPARIPNEPSWSVLSSFAGDLTVDVLLQPRRGSKVGAVAFMVELKRMKGTGRWLVDSMIPEHVFSPAPAPTPTPPAGKTPRHVTVPEQGNHGALSPLWFAVPGALLGMIVLVPIVVLLYTWRRNRAIERRYRAERGF
jgi:hypothetical protein